MEIIDSLVEKAVAGCRLTREEAYTLAEAPLLYLPVLMRGAWAVRRKGHGDVVSVSRNVFIPVTRWCRNACAYCSFRIPVAPPPTARSAPAPTAGSALRTMGSAATSVFASADASPPGAGAERKIPGAHFMTPEEVLELASRGVAAGCKEALIVTGERPEEANPTLRTWLEKMGFSSLTAYIRYLCDLVAAVGLLPHTNVGVVSEPELALLREGNVSMGLMLESTSERLCRPGGPHARSPGKRPALRLAVIGAAGRLKIPFTTGILVGIGETVRERVDALLAISDLHRAYGHIQEVIVQNFTPAPGTPMARYPAPSGPEFLHTVCLARLLLPPGVSLQVPPNLNPGALHQLLAVGVNDWGGISPVTRDEVNPACAWPALEELRAAAEQLGLRLRERLPVYPTFLLKEGFLSPSIREKAVALAAADGYAIVPDDLTGGVSVAPRRDHVAPPS